MPAWFLCPFPGSLIQGVQMAEAVTLTLISQRAQLLSMVAVASQDMTAYLLNRLGRPAETVCLQIKDALCVCVWWGENSLERWEEPQDLS